MGAEGNQNPFMLDDALGRMTWDNKKALGRLLEAIANANVTGTEPVPYMPLQINCMMCPARRLIEGARYECHHPNFHGIDRILAHSWQPPVSCPYRVALSGLNC